MRNKNKESKILFKIGNKQLLIIKNIQGFSLSKFQGNCK